MYQSCQYLCGKSNLILPPSELLLKITNHPMACSWMTSVTFRAHQAPAVMIPWLNSSTRCSSGPPSSSLLIQLRVHLPRCTRSINAWVDQVGGVHGVIKSCLPTNVLVCDSSAKLDGALLKVRAMCQTEQPRRPAEDVLVTFAKLPLKIAQQWQGRACQERNHVLVQIWMAGLASPE